MKIGSFQFTLGEFSGSLGNLGTFLPLAVGYIVVCGLNPAGLLIMMGLANIATGLLYRLPIPIEPMKVIAAAAIAQRWAPSMVYACGFSMGVVWLLFAAIGIAGRIAARTPAAVVRGIQVTLGVLLSLEALRMLSSEWLTGLFALGLGFVLRLNRRVPAAVALVLLGVAVMAMRGRLPHLSAPAPVLPTLTGFSADEVWRSLLLAGFAQIPLTVTNATIATSCLISGYWPERNVTARQLSLSQGVMNVCAPFLGGMPMCHGAGGLAGQYYFGARTGGTNIIEGLLEIGLGLFFAPSVAGLFGAFPREITGAMLLLVGMELIRFARDTRGVNGLISLAVTVTVSLITNMAVGFMAGLAAAWGLSRMGWKEDRQKDR